MGKLDLQADRSPATLGDRFASARGVIEEEPIWGISRSMWTRTLQPPG